jgi:two-component system KDP operon response regulator KdpE
MENLTKVLIVEDDEEIIETLSVILQVKWPEVEIIATDKGQNALLIVEEETPELVILDLGLPDINGFEVLKRIRLFSSIPVVILTVRGDEKDIVRGLELGADEYVVKPFHQMELLARIGVVIRRMNNSTKSIPIAIGKYRL